MNFSRSMNLMFGGNSDVPPEVFFPILISWHGEVKFVEFLIHRKNYNLLRTFQFVKKMSTFE